VITPSIWPTPTGRDWKDGSAKACANIPVNGLLGACAHCKYLNFETPAGRKLHGTIVEFTHHICHERA